MAVDPIFLATHTRILKRGSLFQQTALWFEKNKGNMGKFGQVIYK